MRIRTATLFPIFIVAVLASAVVLPSTAREFEQTIENGEINVADFVELPYPREARLSHVAGAVVIRVKLDSEGIVIRSSAISGAKLLIPACISNANDDSACHVGQPRL